MRLRTKKQKITVTVGDINVHVEPMTPREMADLRQECTPIVGKGPEAREKFDSTEFSTRMFCNVVKSWENAEDDDGNPLECNEANKRAVYEHDQDFAADVMDGMRKKLADRQERIEKN